MLSSLSVEVNMHRFSSVKINRDRFSSTVQIVSPHSCGFNSIIATPTNSRTTPNTDDDSTLRGLLYIKLSQRNEIGIVKGAVIAVTTGDVRKIAVAQDASNEYSTKPLRVNAIHSDGNSKFSIPVK